MRNKIKEIIQQAIKKTYPKSDRIEFSVEDTDEKFGDYSTNIAMLLAQKRAQLRQGYDGRGEKPEEIAHNIINSIKNNEMFETVEVVSPGFINFKLSIPYLQNQILEILKAGEKYGNSDLGKDLKVNVEFISANPTGPLTLGNGRGGYAGDCLARVLESFGAQVEREYYINDRGVQIIKLGHSILKDKQAVYRGKYIDNLKDIISHYHTVQYRSGKVEEIGQLAAAIIMEEYIKKTIHKMSIEFDHWFSETSLYQTGEINKMMTFLNKANLSFQKDGALWLKTSQFGDDKDRVLVTKEGEYTYFASDIAYHWHKIRRGYNLLIDFWGADHHGYINRMQSAIEILRQEENWAGELKIFITQLVRLISKDQEIRMSKRSGTFVTLDELINEVGADVTRFFFLERALTTHMDFDLDLAKERSEKNPVYYVQYAYARIHSILAKSEARTAEGKAFNPKSEINSKSQIIKLIKTKPELDLIKELIKLPDIIIETAEDYQVQRLPYYSIELAVKFHNFYEQCRVISQDNNLTQARISLIKATGIVLKKTLDLMGITAPEKM